MRSVYVTQMHLKFNAQNRKYTQPFVRAMRALKVAYCSRIVEHLSFDAIFLKFKTIVFSIETILKDPCISH